MPGYPRRVPAVLRTVKPHEEKRWPLKKMPEAGDKKGK